MDQTVKADAHNRVLVDMAVARVKSRASVALPTSERETHTTYGYMYMRIVSLLFLPLPLFFSLSSLFLSFLFLSPVHRDVLYSD